jgi:hypothetical protein
MIAPAGLFSRPSSHCAIEIGFLNGIGHPAANIPEGIVERQDAIDGGVQSKVEGGIFWQEDCFV